MQPDLEEKVNQRELSPVQQWDQVAFKLIEQTLAPKGYKEISSGVYRGLVITNSKEPGLIRSKVIECKKISAQLVRSYREQVKKHLQAIVKELNSWADEDRNELAACKFWQYRKRTDLKYKIRSLHGQCGAVQRILHELDEVGIK